MAQVSKISKWGSIRIRQEIVDSVDKFLKSNEGEKLGYSSASQLAEFILRNFLQNPNQTTAIQELNSKINQLDKYKKIQNDSIKQFKQTIDNNILKFEKIKENRLDDEARMIRYEAYTKERERQIELIQKQSNTKLKKMEQTILEIDSKLQRDQIMHEEKIKQIIKEKDELAKKYRDIQISPTTDKKTIKIVENFLKKHDKEFKDYKEKTDKKLIRYDKLIDEKWLSAQKDPNYE